MKITDYFDKIYVINLLERVDRREFMLKQFTQMGWGDALISNKIEFVEAIKIPCLKENVLKYMRENGAGDFFSYATNTDNVGLCNCSIEHYRTIKRAYLKGYNRILVLEDDACFMKNLSELEKALETIPENFDILHIEGYICPSEGDPTNKEGLLARSIEEARWESVCNFPLFGAAALIYSRKGMERYLVNQETYMMFSDYYTLIMNSDSYFYTYPLVIQQDYIYSDIVNENNSTLPFNLYTKYIKREDYYNIREA